MQTTTKYILVAFLVIALQSYLISCVVDKQKKRDSFVASILAAGGGDANAPDYRVSPWKSGMALVLLGGVGVGLVHLQENRAMGGIGGGGGGGGDVQ